MFIDSVTMKKYHGLGNDYLVLDPNKTDLHLQEREVELLCRRTLGVGADGILYGPFFDGEKISVQIYNPDGSEAEKSGNGIRIFAKYLKDEGYVTGSRFTISTLGGDVEIECLNEDGSLIRASMGKADYVPAHIPMVGVMEEVIHEDLEFHGELYDTTCLSVGNPHCIIMTDDVTMEKAKELGPYVENADYFPNRINMELMKVLDRKNILIEIYERGAGYVQACGTGGCAAAAAAYRMGMVDSKVMVHMPGGELDIEIQTDGTIYMTGAVATVGTFTVAENFFA
jgi:diaminopimelate epimerase